MANASLNGNYFIVCFPDEKPVLFGSKAAIFDLFSSKQLGIGFRELYDRNDEFTTNGVIDTGLCKIYSTTVIRKPQKRRKFAKR